jgi:alpha-mannosidase
MVYRNDLPRTFDAWDIEPGFSLGGEELLDLERCEVTAAGPYLAEITVVRTLGASRISQKLRLWCNSARLEIVTDLDWHDRRTYLRAAFPVNVLAEQAAFDQAIGVTWRPTHDNTGWQLAQFEASGHRFVSLGEADWGAALLSADKYGFSAKGNVMTISLVRGPMFPDMLADEGKHHFTYAIMPHDGRWWSEEVQAEADLLVDPLRFVPAKGEPGQEVAPVRWSGLGMRFHALKPAEDGEGHVLRLSEAAGRRGQMELAVDGRVPQAVDGLERVLEDGKIGAITPFHLTSVRF